MMGKVSYSRETNMCEKVSKKFIVNFRSKVFGGGDHITAKS